MSDPNQKPIMVDNTSMITLNKWKPYAQWNWCNH